MTKVHDPIDDQELDRRLRTAFHTVMPMLDTRQQQGFEAIASSAPTGTPAEFGLSAIPTDAADTPPNRRLIPLLSAAAAVPDPRRSRVLLVAASVAVLVGAGGLIWASSSRTQPPAASSTFPAPVDTSLRESASVSTPGITPGISPAEFPDDVPRPDTFELMTYITVDNERIGWEFFDQREPTDSVERCTRYASSFGPSWTATPKTDEHASVIYAHILDNGQWQVGIYCINDGGYIVQVMPTNTTFPLTADTVPPQGTRPDVDAVATTTVVFDAPHPTSTTTPPPGFVGYVIVAGDSVARIAADHGMTVDDLSALNGWTDGAAHMIFPGDVVFVRAG